MSKKKNKNETKISQDEYNDWIEDEVNPEQVVENNEGIDDYYQHYGTKSVKNEARKKKQLVEKLLTPPKKDKGVNQQHFQPVDENDTHQMDLLELPNDNGYNYALVIVDIGSRKVDAEPLDTKTSLSVRNGIVRIYNRRLLKRPKHVEVDDGSEFKGEVVTFFKERNVTMRVAQPKRHRQQGLVERANQTIGLALFKRMYSNEILDNKINSEWVDILPDIIKGMNERAAARKPMKYIETPLCEGDSCNMLQIGDKVRVALDSPRELITKKAGNKRGDGTIWLQGRFRSTDIRWHPDVRTIVDIKLLPNRPVQYVLNEPAHVWFTKNQLQLVEGEEMPPESVRRTKPVPKPKKRGGDIMSGGLK
ncbi:TPA_asm: integrase [Capsaspora MELD virus 2]|nr:TPA_asm: integrase [Capsaspora MELD virus 2]